MLLSSPSRAQVWMILSQGWFSPKGAAHSAQDSLELLSGSARGRWRGSRSGDTKFLCKMRCGVKAGRFGTGMLTLSPQKPSWHLGWVLLGLGGWGFVNCSGVPLSVRPRRTRSAENSPKNSGVGSHCNGWSCFTSPEIQVGALII